MNRFRHTLMTAALALAALVSPTFVAPALAQTTMNMTYLNANIDAKTQVIPLVSVSNITASSRNLDGDYIFIDREAMQVNAVDTVAKTVTVRRGVASTGTGVSVTPVGQTVHSSGTVVWTGPKRAFNFNQVSGPCTASNELYLPHITLPGANTILGGLVEDCVNGTWTEFKSAGYIAAAGLIDTSSTASGTTQSTEYTLNTVTIPATDFASARGVRCLSFGTAAGNANAKTYKMYFGSTVVATATSVTSNAKDYVVDMTVFRTGQSTQAAVGTIVDGTTPSVLAEGSSVSMTEAEGSAIVIKFTSINTAAAAASATGKGLYCHWLP